MRSVARASSPGASTRTRAGCWRNARSIIEFLRFCGLTSGTKGNTLMETSSSKFARCYDRECKENAVALVQSGRSLTEVARDLGVSHWSLSRWSKEAQAGQNLSEPKTSRPRPQTSASCVNRGLSGTTAAHPQEPHHTEPAGAALRRQARRWPIHDTRSR